MNVSWDMPLVRSSAEGRWHLYRLRRASDPEDAPHRQSDDMPELQDRRRRHGACQIRPMLHEDRAQTAMVDVEVHLRPSAHVSHVRDYEGDQHRSDADRLGDGGRGVVQHLDPASVDGMRRKTPRALHDLRCADYRKGERWDDTTKVIRRSK